jgi:hypothetical protein
VEKSGVELHLQKQMNHRAIEKFTINLKTDEFKKVFEQAVLNRLSQTFSGTHVKINIQFHLFQFSGAKLRLPL